MKRTSYSPIPDWLINRYWRYFCHCLNGTLCQNWITVDLEQPTTNQQPINQPPTNQWTDQPPTNDQPMDWPTNQPSDSRLKDKETNEWNGQRTSLRDVGLRYWFPSQLCPSRRAVLYCIILHKLSVIYYLSGWTIF